VVLTSGLWRPELRWTEENDDDRRRKGSALAEEGDAGALRATGHRGLMRGGPVKAPKGLGEFGDRRR
jgi:hypothetical protein